MCDIHIYNTPVQHRKHTLISHTLSETFEHTPKPAFKRPLQQIFELLVKHVCDTHWKQSAGFLDCSVCRPTKWRELGDTIFKLRADLTVLTLHIVQQPSCHQVFCFLK